MTFWSERQHTARKVHQCDECQTEIGPGTTYTRGAGINVNGDFGSWITHTDCLVSTREQHELAGLGPDEWWPLHEWIWELPQDALNAFVADYPAVYARVAPNLIRRGRIAVAPLNADDASGRNPS